MSDNDESERAIHRSATNQNRQTENGSGTKQTTTMNTTTNTDDDEQTNDYHVLPALLGEAITHEDYGVHHCGGYLVRRLDNGTISIYRAIDHAPTREDLDVEGDYVAEMSEYVVSGEEYVDIPAPEGGWESETDAIPESIWEGYE